ncbi:MAG: LysM peptidoglycan-binding domain-containing protein, partial [bacterium]
MGAHVSVLTLAVIFGGCVKGKKVPKLTSAAPVRELQAPEAMPEPILEPEGMVEETDLLVSREPEVIPPRVDAVLSPPPHATAVPREERRAKIAESKEEEIADLAAEKERALTAAAEKREKKIEALAEKKEKELSAHAERKERGPIVPSVKRREATSKASAARRRAGGGTHKVVPGDSLWKMSQRYGVSVAELARVNGLERDSVIRVGQVLVIPAPSATRMPSKEKKPVRKAVEKKAPVVV